MLSYLKGLVSKRDNNRPSPKQMGWFKELPTEQRESDSERASSEDEPLTGGYEMQIPKKRTCISVRALIFHLSVMAFYTFLFFGVVGPRLDCRDARSNIVRSPANAAVKLEPLQFNADLCIDTPFMGPPSEETDKAWADMLQYSHVKLTGRELEDIGQTSIPLPDEEDAYWGMIGVTHELHCLKRLRQYMYKDHYFPNLTAEEDWLNLLHSGHCIEILRQSAMCRGDVSVITMYWRDDVKTPIADFSLPHSCVNWDSLQGWAKDRAFNPMRPGYMKHPHLGSSFADGHSHDIGVVDPTMHKTNEAQTVDSMGRLTLPKSCRA